MHPPEQATQPSPMQRSSKQLIDWLVESEQMAFSGELQQIQKNCSKASPRPATSGVSAQVKESVSAAVSLVCPQIPAENASPTMFILGGCECVLGGLASCAVQGGWTCFY